VNPAIAIGDGECGFPEGPQFLSQGIVQARFHFWRKNSTISARPVPN
jgi:hypothetical protein